MKLDSTVRELIAHAISTLTHRELEFRYKYQTALEINREILHRVDLEQYQKAVFLIVKGFYEQLIPLVNGSRYLSRTLKKMQSDWLANHSIIEFDTSIFANCAKISRDVHLYQKLKGKTGLEIYSILNHVYIYEIPLSEEMKEEVEALFHLAK